MSSNIIILSDRIKESSYSTGNGNFELFGAVPGLVLLGQCTPLETPYSTP